MGYTITDFFCYEQKLIDKLREKGFFVYSVVDAERNTFNVVRNGRVNRIGFLVSEEDVLSGVSDDCISSETLVAKFGHEESSILEKIKAVGEEISEVLKAEKKAYDAAEEKRNETIKRLMERQENELERNRYYNLYLRKDNPVVLKNGFAIRFQTIRKIDDDVQRVMYFIRDPEGNIVVDSTEKQFKVNEKYMAMAKAIAKEHNIAA